MSNQNKVLEQRILEVVDQYRSMILDPCEQELGGSKNWKYLRSRLLKCLGDRGLAGRISQIFAEQLNGFESQADRASYDE